MENKGSIIYMDTGAVKKPVAGSSLFENRINMYESLSVLYPYEASIFILAYNHLESTRICVECVLEHTVGIHYELILVDNGSSDGTLEYFQSIPYADKKIVRVTKNIGANFPINNIFPHLEGKYIVQLPNDVHVTARWLSNLLKCYESDHRVGLAVPVSSNISNMQQVDLNFSTPEEMQTKAEAFNRSNPRKWKERMRLMPVVTIYRRELIDLVHAYDYGFSYDFADDDYCVRIRRAGYKLILCEDTFVDHAHKVWEFEKKDPEEFRISLQSGRNNYMEKYFGVDGWDDINNFEEKLIPMLPPAKKDDNSILGIDVRCGTPILEIKNHLREQGKSRATCKAFTTQAKYYVDLQTVVRGGVICDRMDYLAEYYSPNSVDYLILGEPLNTYARPIQLMQRLLEMVKPRGCLLFKLANVADWRAFLDILGQPQNADDTMPIYINRESICTCLKMMGVKHVRIKDLQQEMAPDDVEALRGLVSNISNSVEETLDRLCKEYTLFCVER